MLFSSSSSDAEHNERNRRYRCKVKCSVCLKVVDSDYKNQHIETKHKDERHRVTFSTIVENSQQTLGCFIKHCPAQKADDKTCAGPSGAGATNLDSIENVEDEDRSGNTRDLDVEDSKKKITADADITMYSEPDSDSEHMQTTHQEDIEIEPFQPILEKYNPQSFGNETFVRDCQPSWYDKYPWISFNKDKNTAKCFPCEKYKKCVFEFSNWKKFERLAKHANSHDHREAMTNWIQHRYAVAKNKTVTDGIITAHERFVKKNRQYLRVIIECLLFTAQQNIAQRAHEEVRLNLSLPSDVNRGNFLELLHLRTKDIAWLADEVESRASSKRQWVSPAIQNEIIDIMCHKVLTGISEEIANCFVGYAVIVDETTDITREEQVSISLRFVDESDIIKETFVSFELTHSTTGEALCNLIKEVVGRLKLDVKKIVGQCYDGASNMKGKDKGVQALLKVDAPQALYVHCYGHRLNLAVQGTLTKVLSMKKLLVRYKDCTTSLKVAQKDTLSSKEYAIRKKKRETDSEITKWYTLGLHLHFSESCYVTDCGCCRNSYCACR